MAIIRQIKAPLGNANRAEHSPDAPVRAPIIIAEQIIPWSVAAMLLGVAFVAWRGGALETAPKTCSDITIREMNGVVRNSMLGKLLGYEVRDIENTRDVGSDRNGLMCEARVLTNHGEMYYSISTHFIHGKWYIEGQPDLGWPSLLHDDD